MLHMDLQNDDQLRAQFADKQKCRDSQLNDILGHKNRGILHQVDLTTVFYAFFLLERRVVDGSHLHI
jgi:hypothetical protein